MGDKSSVKTYFLGDTAALDRAAAKARKSIDSVGNSASKSSGRMGGAFSSMGASAKAGIAGLVGGSILAAGAKVFDLAANMQLMDAKAKTVFGNQIGVVQKWAKANANAMGLTSKEAVGLSANFADLLIPMGFTRQAAAKMSTDVVGLSGALSRWSGGTKSAAEVSEILAKAMLGERDGLKELGISISEADVQNRLLRDGKAKLTGAALEQAKAEATQALIMEKSTDAQTAYAQGTTTLAAKKAQLTARIKELRDSAIASLIPKLVALGNWINTNVVPAVARLVAGFHSGTGAGGQIRAVVDRIRQAFQDNKPAIMEMLRTLGTFAKFIGEKVVPLLLKFYGHNLKTLISVVGKVAAVFNTVKDAVQAVVDAIQAMIKAIKNIPGGGIAGKVGGLVGKIPGFATGTQSAPRGLAVVGETGPELVNFRGGEQVIPNGGSRSSGGGSRGNRGDNDRPIVVQLVLDGKVIQESLLRRKRTLGGSLGLA